MIVQENRKHKLPEIVEGVMNQQESQHIRESYLTEWHATLIKKDK